MEQKTFRAAIIGCGGISKVHSAALQGMKNVEIAAVVEELIITLRSFTAANTEDDSVYAVNLVVCEIFNDCVI